MGGEPHTTINLVDMSLKATVPIFMDQLACRHTFPPVSHTSLSHTHSHTQLVAVMFEKVVL